jgi:hypothetical protein
MSQPHNINDGLMVDSHFWSNWDTNMSALDNGAPLCYDADKMTYVRMFCLFEFFVVTVGVIMALFSGRLISSSILCLVAAISFAQPVIPAIAQPVPRAPADIPRNSPQPLPPRPPCCVKDHVIDLLKENGVEMSDDKVNEFLNKNNLRFLTPEEINRLSK